MKTQQQRINNVIGQLDAIKTMMNQEKDCFAILIQLKAVKSALSKIMYNHIQEQMLSCINLCGTDEDKKKLQDLLAEITK